MFPKIWFLRTTAYVEFSISTPIALVVTDVLLHDDVARVADVDRRVLVTGRVVAGDGPCAEQIGKTPCSSVAEVHAVANLEAVDALQAQAAVPGALDREAGQLEAAHGHGRASNGSDRRVLADQNRR